MSLVANIFGIMYLLYVKFPKREEMEMVCMLL